MNTIGKELASALTAAQAEIEDAATDKTNPHFRSKYADLGNVIDAIKPALSKYGLSFVQVCHDSEGAAKIETLIIHKSGESLSAGTISVPVSKADAQGYGSALTYARRYSLSAAFGVAPEDDDGNAAAKARPVKLASVNGPATPSGGVWDSMDEPTQRRLQGIADEARSLIEEGRVSAAVKVIEGESLDADQKVALWSRFDSKERSAMKTATEDMRKANV